MKRKLIQALPLLIFSSVLLAAVVALQDEPLECNCVVECYLDEVSGKRSCECPPDNCALGNYWCEQIANGTGSSGPRYRCQCKEATDPDTAAFWEAECLCKYGYMIGSGSGICYPECDKKHCSNYCDELDEGEFTEESQPCCTCVPIGG